MLGGGWGCWEPVREPSILESVFPVLYPIKLVRTQLKVHSWTKETGRDPYLGRMVRTLDAYRLHDVQQPSTLNPKQQSSSHVGLLFTLYGLVVYCYIGVRVWGPH